MKKLSTKAKRITVILFGMMGLSTLTFNCAPSAFSPMHGDFSSSSLGSVLSLYNSPQTSPFALMTAKQTYETMLNVTGQSQAATTTQLNEYDARVGALSLNSRLTNVNAPLQLAATSLAGEICNGLVAKEMVAGATRKFFASVDFTTGLTAQSGNAFSSTVAVMAQSFWNRAPTSDEASQLNAFYTDFAASAGTNAAATKTTYIATCTAMLGSFDTYNY